MNQSEKLKLVVIGNGMGEPTRLASIARRVGERPARDGRAGGGKIDEASPGTAVPAGGI